MPTPTFYIRFLFVTLLITTISVFPSNVWGQCSVSVGPANNYGCLGGSATFTATLTNPPTTPTYSWSGPNGFTANTASITLNNLANSNAGTYTVTIGGGCTGTNTASVNLGVLSNFTISQGDITLCPGQSNISFNPTISGNNSLTPLYSWNGPNTFSSTNPTPAINNATAINSGNYGVTATIGQCSATDNSNVLVLNGLDVTATSNGPLCQGQTLNLTSTVTGNAGQSVSYSWAGPDNFTSTQANPSISNVGAAQNGQYTVTVSSNGCSDNISTTANILTPSVTSSQFSANSNYTGWLVRCTLPGEISGPIAISNGIQSSLNSFANTYNINWGDGSPNTTFNTDSWIAPHDYPLGLYTLNLSITSTSGCTSTNSYQVFVGNQPASPQIQLPANAQGCSPFNLTFPISGVSNNVPGTTYTITFSDGSAPLTYNQSNIPSSVQHTFSQSSCGFSFTNGTITENNAFGVSMQAVNPCGSASASAGPIRTSAPPSISFNLPNIVCINENAVADNTSSPGNINQGAQCIQAHSFIWNITPSAGWSIGTQTLGSTNSFPAYYDFWTSGSDPLSIYFNQSGTYSIQLIEKNACANSENLTKTICVIDPPTCSFTATPSTGCSPLTVNTTNNSVAPQCNGTAVPLAYSWVVSTPTNASYATSNLAQPNFSLINSGSTNLTYTITLTVTPLDPVTNLPIGNCNSVCSQTVVVQPTPYISTQPTANQTICVGGIPSSLSVSYANGSGTPSYQWYSNSVNSNTGGTSIAGASASSYTPPALNSTGNFYYYCVVSFNATCGPITSNPACVSVVADPLINTQPSSTQTLCVGGIPSAITFAASGGVGNITYQWFSNSTGSTSGGTAISSQTNTSFTPPSQTVAGTYYYYGVATISGSGCGTVTTNSSNVVFIADPTITSIGNAQTLCQNSPAAAINVAITGGNGTASYQWYCNTTNNNSGGIAVGTNSSSYTPLTDVVGTRYYYCIVTQTTSGCSVTSNTVQITTNNAPTINAQPIGSNVCVGGGASQMCVTYLNGAGTPTYQWYSNSNNSNIGGNAITGATSNCYTPPSTSAGTTYYYATIAFTSGGCNLITSNTAQVIISPDPVIASQPTASQTICAGGTPSAISVSLQANTGIGIFTYQWYSNTSASNSGGTLITGATSSTYLPPVLNSSGSYYYYCVITDAGNGCGSVNSNVAQVDVVNDPSISTQPISTQTICQNATASSISVAASGGTGTLLYQWYSNTANNTTSGTAIPAASSSSYTPPTANTGTTYYYCIVTTAASGCAVTSNSSAVVVTAGPIINTQPTSSNVCVDGAPTQMCVTYTNGTGTPSYQWYSNATNANSGGTAVTGATASCYTPPAAIAGTTYYYAVISLTGGGCASINSNTAQVIITPDPSIANQPTTLQTICVGGTVGVLSVAMQANTGIGAFSYQWYSNNNNSSSGGTIIPSATSASYTPPAFNTIGSYYYYCVITNAGSGCGAVNSAVAEVNVVADPTISNQPTTTQTLCQNAAAATIWVTATGGTGTLLYQWYSNTANNTTSGIAITGATTSSLTPPTTNTGTTYYYCIVTTAASGCSVTSNTSAVVVTPAPSFTTQPLNSNVCVDGTTNQMCVTYNNGTGTPAYQWYSNTTNTNSGGTAVTGATASCFTPPAAIAGTTYYYAVISLTGGGCANVNSNTAQVIITPDPSIATQPTTLQSICVGGTAGALEVTMQANTGIGAFSFQWYSNNNNSSSSGTIIPSATSASYTPPTFNTIGSYYFYCVVTNAGNGCGTVNSAVAQVDVVADPSISNQPITTQTLCQGATASTLSVTATGGTGTLLYQWYSNTANNTTSGVAISGATTSSLTPPTANTGTIYYYCIVTTSASGCSVASNTSAVVVTPAPSFTTQPVNSNVCVDGAPTQMCVTYTNGTGTPAYQWYSNTTNTNSGGTAIVGATTNCYTPPAITAGTTYYYAMLSLSGGGCTSISTNTAEVIITPDPSIATQPTALQSICVGGSASPLSVTMQANTGIGAFSFQWYSNNNNSSSGGTIIPSATSASFTPPAFNTIGSYYYYCVITNAGNGCGTVNSAVAQVDVVADPSISNQPITTQTLCQGATASTLSVTATGGTGTLLYQWYSNTANNTTSGVAISGATTSSLTPPTANIGTIYYYCIVSTSASGCSAASNTSAVVVTPAPSFTTQPVNSNVCVDGAPNQMCVTYTNGTGTPAYQWYSNTTNTNSGGTAVTGATASCFTPPAAIAGTTYYYAVISLTGGGCANVNSNTAQVIITPDPSIATQPTALQSICVGGSASPLSVTMQANTGIGAFSFQWYSNNNNSSSGGTIIPSATSASFTPPAFNTIGSYYYYCVITNAGNGCGTVNSAVSQVDVVADPSISNQPITTQTLCQGATASTLSVTATGGTGTLLYQWYSNTANNTTSGVAISGATTSSLTPPTANIGTIYYYCIVSTSASGCSVASNTSAVVVTPAPSFTTQPANSNVCVDGTTNQMCVTYNNGTGTPAYQWYSNTTNTNSGGTAISGATVSCYTPPAAIAGTTYYYASISLTGGGCSSISSNTAEVIITPDPAIATQPIASQSICVGGSIANPLSVSYSDGLGTASYQWYNATTSSAIVGATNSSYTPGTFNSTGSNLYYVSISYTGSGCNSISSNNAEVIVVSDPSSTISTGSTYCQFSTNLSALTANIQNGIGTSSYQWYVNNSNSSSGGNLITGATSSSFTPSSQNVGTFYYYCVITQSGQNCGVTTTTATINITPQPTFSQQPISTQSLCINNPSSALNVGYNNGTGTPSYQWYSNTNNSNFGGSIIIGSTNATYTPPTNTAGTFYYYCEISFSSNGGCPLIVSNVATVQVNPEPVINNLNQTICSGQNFNFDIAILDPTSLVPSGTTYTWNIPVGNGFTGATTNLVGSSTINQTLTNNSINAVTATYTITPTTSFGCIGIDFNLTVNINPSPTVTFSPAPQTICSGDTFNTVTLSTSTSNPSYTWSAIANGVNGVVLNGSIGTITSQTLINPTNSPLTVTYTASAELVGSGCPGVGATYTITVNPTPNISIPTQTICSNTAFSVSPTNGSGNIVPAGTTYSWAIPPANPLINGTSAQINVSAPISQTLVNLSNSQQAINYTISPISSGCPGADFVVNINVNPTPVIPNQNITICGGENAQLNLSNSQPVTILPNATTFSWNIPTNTANISGATVGTALSNFQQTLMNGVNVTQTITYSITPTSGSCSGSAFDAVITIDPTPVVSNVNQTICSGDGFNIIPNSSIIPAGTTYSWPAPTTPNTLTTYASGTAQSDISGTLTNSTNTDQTAVYNVTPTSPQGCVGSVFAATINVHPTPIVADLTDVICSGSTFSVVPNNNPITNIIPSNINYTWTAPTGSGFTGGAAQSNAVTTISQSLNNTTVDPVTATYTVTPSTTFSCPGAAFTVVVIINPSPAVTFSPAPQTICSGTPFNTVTLSSTSNNVSFAWTAAANGITGATLNGNTNQILSETLTNPSNASLNVVYTATAEVLGSGCPGSPADYVITVKPRPSIANQSANICSGNSFAFPPFLGTIIIPNNTTYTWPNPIETNINTTIGGQEQFTPSNNIFGSIINNTYQTQTLTYTVTANTIDNCPSSPFEVVVNVNPAPVIPNQSGTICGGDNITINFVDAPGNLPITIVPNGTAYSWSLPSTTGNILGATSVGSSANFNQTLSNSSPDIQTATYTVTPNAGNCPGAPFQVVVTVNPTPDILDISESSCSGAPFSTTPISGIIPNGTTYNWNVPAYGPNLSGGAANSNQNTIFGQLVSNTNTDQMANYTVIPTSNLGCEGESFDIQMTIHPTPIVLDINQIYCGNDNIVILPLDNSPSEIVPNNILLGWTVSSVDPGLSSYSELNNQPNFNQNITNNTNIIQSIQYNIIPTTPFGCIGNNFFIDLDIKPIPTTDPVSNQTWCALHNTNPVLFTGNIIGTTYNWINDNTTIGLNNNGIGDINSYMAINNSQLVQVATISITPTFNGCTGLTTNYNYSIQPLPISNFALPALGCTDVALPIVNNAQFSSSYVWYVDNNITTNGLNPIIIIQDTGSFVIDQVVFNTYGCADTTSKEIELIKSPEAIFSMAFDPSNCGPLDVAFSNSSEGKYNAYNWDFEISTSTLTDPFNVIFPPTDTIIYYAIELTASNFCGTSIEADSILVNPLPIVDFIGSLDSLWGCSPLHISFNNMSTGIPDNYLWEYGDGDFSTLFEEQEHVYFADSTIMVYETTLIATNECGVDSMSLYVTVKPNTVSAFHQIPFNTGCEPFLVCFTDYSEGVDNGTSTYNFGNGESSSLFEPCYTFDDAGSYIVSQIVSNGCAFDTAYSYITVLEQPEISVFADTNKVCANVPVYFTSNVNTLVNYTWNFNDGYQSNESSPNHIFANSGPYWVILDAVGANNCSASDSVQIQVYSVPIANFTFPSATGCSPFQLCASSAVSAGNFYYWDFGDGTTGVGNVSCHNYINPGNTIINYDVTLYVENVFQCRDTAIQEINILPQPTSAFNLGSFESCSYPISVATNNFSQEAFGYEWYINGDSVTNEFNPALTFDTVGNYQINLVAINQYNCTSSSIAEFEVHPVPVIDFILNPPSGCTPLIVEIQNNTAEANDYIWSLGDGAIDYSTNPTHIYEPPGTYDIQLIATNNFGCRDTLLQEDAIEVYPVPYPEISYNPSQPSVYDKQIYFQDVGGGASSWDWNFGDGNYGYVQFYQHEYMFPATYIVTLNVQNEYGCTARDVASITIKEDFMIFVPNAFTPHIPDGTNDYFKPIIQGENLIQRYKFQIFNRWGDVVFETNDPKEAWVGNHRGGDYYVEDGIYNWTIEVDILNGDETKFLNGHVTIIR